MEPITVGSIKGKLLEIQENSFDGSDGKKVNYTRLVVRTPKGIVQLKPHGDFDFTSYLDKDISLDIALSIFNMKGSLVVTGVNGKVAVPKAQ